MIRTQVSLHKQEYDLAKREAKALGISLAEFVRRAVRDKLPISEEQPWMRYAGMVESGDPHSSASIDRGGARLVSSALRSTSRFIVLELYTGAAPSHCRL